MRFRARCARAAPPLFPSHGSGATTAAGGLRRARIQTLGGRGEEEIAPRVLSGKEGVKHGAHTSGQELILHHIIELNNP